MTWQRTLAALTFLLLPLAIQAQQGPLELTSPLGRKLYALPDDAALAAAKQALAADPKSPALALKLSLAFAARRQYTEAVATDTAALNVSPQDATLWLERGHRLLGLRRFVEAQRDLDRAIQLNPALLDAHYHDGLALYFQGHFAGAAQHFNHACDLAAKAPLPDDSLIDCSAWAYNSFSRAGDSDAAAKVLSHITPKVKNTEPHLYFYLQLLHFYQGLLTVQQILPSPPAPADTEAALSFNTISYGVGNFYLAHAQPDAARPLFEKVVTGEAWNSWGFVGSETDLLRAFPAH